MNKKCAMSLCQCPCIISEFGVSAFSNHMNNCLNYLAQMLPNHHRTASNFSPKQQWHLFNEKRNNWECLLEWRLGWTSRRILRKTNYLCLIKKYMLVLIFPWTAVYLFCLHQKTFFLQLPNFWMNIKIAFPTIKF